MPKLYSARQVLSALQKLGFSIVSQRGSHIKLRKKIGVITHSPIVPHHKQIAHGTFQSILKQAGITKEEFEKEV